MAKDAVESCEDFHAECLEAASDAERLGFSEARLPEHHLVRGAVGS